MNIKQLSNGLEQMSEKAASLDHQRGHHEAMLFDERLFRCRSRLLVPCVNEARATLNDIIKEQKEGELNAQRAEYLTDRLVAQITAIQREISIAEIPKAKPKKSARQDKSLDALKQEVAQHKEWARRLREMVIEKQQIVAIAPAHLRTEAQKAVLTAKQRLIRCEAALSELEKQVTQRENN